MSTQQFLPLLRNFFKRLFENEIVADDVDLSDSLSWLVPMFAAPAMLVALRLLPKYAVLEHVSPDLFEAASWPDKLFFLGYSMTAAGLLTVLVWGALYPDRRDAMVLGPLPVHGWTVLSAKVTALLTLIIGFGLAINLLPAGAFAFAAAAASGTLLTVTRHVLAHLVATVAAGTFVFLALTALQTTLVLVLPPRALRTCSVLMQLVFVVALLEWCFFAPALLERLGVSEGWLTQTDVSAWLPPLWFLGLYEVLLGSERSAFGALAANALLAMAATLGLAVAAYAASYRRVIQHAVARPELSSRRPGPFARWIRRVTFATLMRHPVERAVFDFVTKSLLRSPRHRLTIAAYLGVALAFIVGGFLGPLLRGPVHEIRFSEPSAALLSIPFVLSFFVLVALRILFAVPTELKANWIFQMTESDDKVYYLSGIRKTTALLGLAPITLTTLPVYGALWGAATALAHTVFWLLLAAVLVELLLVGFYKMPFTCSYVPGKANLKLLWPLYLFAMTTYAYATARIESWLLADLTRWVIACAMVVLGLAAIAVYRRRRPTEALLTYDERAESTVQVLDLA